LNTPNQSNKLNIGIITTESFPIGMAGTNRIISWATILASNGNSIKAYIIKPTEHLNNIQNKSTSGIFKGISFKYVNKTTIWPKSKNKLYKLFTIFRSYYQMILTLHHDKPSIIITYTNDNIIRIILILIRPVLGFKIVTEETEYPKVLKKKHNRFIQNLYLSLYRFSNGMFVITKELHEYYQNIGARNIFYLPMTVDNSRFTNLKKSTTSSQFFLYVGGSGGFIRDGVLDIIKAFKSFSPKFPHFKLLVVGPIEKTDESSRAIENYIDENKLQEKVILTGSMSTQDIPQLLSEATGIVMAPTKNFVSGGFPTKLGEFLAAGSPVICTRVSDIPQFLNETNSYLSDPGDIYSLSKSMEEIVEYPEKSRLIGQKGKELAITVFNAESYKNSLINYLNSLL
jgi:glycosyltransferase involved in cell wall biosynthesis